MSIRTRFAPSPTGYLHIGGVRTALFNWILAKQSGGQFVLRIDDTDAKRNLAEALQPILDGFQWLGIDWDEGPTTDGKGSCGPHGSYFQSQRLDKYQSATQALLADGHAYRDYSRPEEYTAERELAEKEKREFSYSRTWMAETDEQAKQFESEGRSSVVRLKMPREGRCEFTDLIRGDLSFEWAGQADTVIQRADGTCLYHLASVVDDHNFQITHVVRATEHLANTPRQIFIAQSLGYDLPRYAHIPFVAEPGSKRKLSKRNIEKYLDNKDFKRLYQSGVDIATRIGLQPKPESFNPVLIDFYRDIGFLPDALMNYLLLLGWSLDDQTENFSREQMFEHFSLERVIKSEASFDSQKLLTFQQRYMDQLPLAEKTTMCVPFLRKANLVSDRPAEEVIQMTAAIIAAAGDRICIAGDILKFDTFFIDDQTLEFEEKPFVKRIVRPEHAGRLLSEIRNSLDAVEDFSAAAIESAIQQFCQQQDVVLSDIIHALRVAATGKAAGFGMFDTLGILGKKRSIFRIDRALAELDSRAQQSPSNQ